MIVSRCGGHEQNPKAGLPAAVYTAPVPPLWRALIAGDCLPVRELTEDQFNSLALPDSCRALWEHLHEVEWYANSAGTLLGVVLFNPTTNYWGYVMCSKMESGEFQRLGIGADFTALEMARRDLAANMDRHVTRHPPDWTTRARRCRPATRHYRDNPTFRLWGPAVNY